MPELYTKDKNGNLNKVASIDNDTAHLVVNDINDEVLEKEIKNFWTPEKCGKHKDIAYKHKSILKKTLRVKPEDLFEQLNNNVFNVTEFTDRSLSKFLHDAKIDDYVSENYVNMCNKVVTPRPSIGRGEFLFAATFKNLSFSTGSGDLVDDKGNRIEFKGIEASLGGDGPFKQMSRDVILGIFREFETNRQSESLTLDIINEIGDILEVNSSKVKLIMKLLQNLDNSSDKLADEMVTLFKNHKDLKNVIAAAHLMAYGKLQKADYLIALNDKKYSCFKIPTNLEDAYNIIKQNFNVYGWSVGNKGITINLK